MALYHYTYRIMGIKLRTFPTTKGAIKFEFSQAAILTVLLVAGRRLSEGGLEGAGLSSAIRIFVLEWARNTPI